MRIEKGLVNFIKDLIGRRKLYLKLIFDFNWRKLKSGSQFIILKS